MGKQPAVKHWMSSGDPRARAWRREQMEISNDISGLPRDPEVDALVANLDLMKLSDEERILALTQYFTQLASGGR